MGRNNLNSLLSRMCQEAGITGRKTSHSLRATGATTLFNAQVPEKMIKDITRHCSSKALSLYESPSLAQKQVVMAGGVSFSEEVHKITKKQDQELAIPSTQAKVHAAHSHSVSDSSSPAGDTQLNINFGANPGIEEQLEEFDALVAKVPAKVPACTEY